ncbi:putative mitochondrial saccharopine dehydrogenase-like oxidoreductase [Cucumis melo var. makuwa]|uniref:Mitochondrial saccharopine dehydrogenase-like oxidoreductase n=2 Tax=Cucumis melo TaxID=3656 RepID=A0A5D3DPV4_CUCMM|nr:putative mitochondrial saccharopine dehydrogenase-like oxidoreductase [Cucumis melo var. makuwa]TYK25604.1 putative mitochondrial saccharopine dehydrogenase-like oxidoreductase [Cucumis melo var. makuwa]
MSGGPQQVLLSTPPYDLIILGATGFTGKYIVREALKFLNPSSSSPLKSLALAGRDHAKLTNALKWAAHPLPSPPIPLLISDITKPQSIRHLCTQTKLILNCVGPFRRYGEPVVAACVETGCDYLDICGEPEFMERMEAKYDGRAVETGSLVVSGCGFDSIPAELGLIFNLRHWVGKSTPSWVEAYVNVECSEGMTYNFGTYESAVLGVANADALVQLRRSRPPRRRPKFTGGAPPKGPLIEHKKEIGLWAVRIPSADSSVVRRTLSTLAQNPQQIKHMNTFWSSVKPARFIVKIGTKSFLEILRCVATGMFIGMFAKNPFGRWLLLTFPSIFTLGLFNKKGPSEDEVNNGSFKMWFVGHGFDDNGNDKEIVTRIMGPEPGYITTSIILIQCAFVLLAKRHVMPKGGVLTPGIVFGPTHLQQRLQENGISFDVISNHNDDKLEK